MFNPKKEFEINKKKFNSELNFSYSWKPRSDNSNDRQKLFEEYKDKLGWYIEIYNIPENTGDPYVKIYPVYEKISNALSVLKSIEEKIKSSLEHKYDPDGDNFIFKKGNYIYKGTKYFYTPTDEKEFYKSVPFGYYGDKYVGYYYSRRYSGGLQVYKLKKDLKLFNITNDRNMYMILDLIQTEFKKGNSDKIFFDKITYKEFYKAVKVKYGVGINKYFQAYNISKYSRFNDMWLYLPEGNLESYANNTDKSYTGWYYGAGHIDRVCAHGIMLLIKDKFDGITGKTGFYTPFSSLTGTEVIIWDQDNALQRRPNHKYDSMQFIKHLHFNPFDIKFDIKFSAKNVNFKLIDYYLNNKMDQKQIDDFKKIQISKTETETETENKIKVFTLNIHNFHSINLNDQPYYILEHLLSLIDNLGIDICFLQEYYTDLEIESKKYKYIKDPSHLGLVVLYKKDLPITNISSVKLYNEQYFDQRRWILSFDLFNKKFVNTHLEIGKRFFDRSGSTFYANELYNIIKFNYNLRKKQLKQIINLEPDFIIGDFNFNNLDLEYKFLIDEGYYTGLVGATTPFGKQVDFIFAKKPYNHYTKINFQYSDHQAMVGIINI
jgi:endonuclease/exonuclease/phosphatase family metal-dependent hydrolase